MATQNEHVISCNTFRSAAKTGTTNPLGKVDGVLGEKLDKDRLQDLCQHVERGLKTLELFLENIDIVASSGKEWRFRKIALDDLSHGRGEDVILVLGHASDIVRDITDASVLTWENVKRRYETIMNNRSEDEILEALKDTNRIVFILCYGDLYLEIARVAVEFLLKVGREKCDEAYSVLDGINSSEITPEKVTHDLVKVFGCLASTISTARWIIADKDAVISHEWGSSESFEMSTHLEIKQGYSSRQQTAAVLSAEFGTPPTDQGRSDEHHDNKVGDVKVDDETGYANKVKREVELVLQCRDGDKLAELTLHPFHAAFISIMHKQHRSLESASTDAFTICSSDWLNAKGFTSVNPMDSDCGNIEFRTVIRGKKRSDKVIIPAKTAFTISSRFRSEQHLLYRVGVQLNCNVYEGQYIHVQNVLEDCDTGLGLALAVVTLHTPDDTVSSVTVVATRHDGT